MPMLPQVQSPFDALEERRRRFLAELEELSDVERRFRPRPDAWNLLQIARHLLLAEELGVVRAIESGWAARVTKPRWSQRLVGRPIVAVVMRLGIKVGVPRPQLAPEPEPDLADTVRRWEAARTYIRNYLEGLSPEALNRTFMRHPVAGPVTTLAGLSFLVRHMDRHMRQAQGVRTAANARMRQA